MEMYVLIQYIIKNKSRSAKIEILLYNGESDSPKKKSFRVVKVLRKREKNIFMDHTFFPNQVED